MIISCIKSVFSFLNFFLNSKEEVNTHSSMDPPAANRHLHNVLSPACGLGLITHSISPNILTSAAIRPPPPPPSQVEKIDSGGTFLGGGVGGRGKGLTYVTESLLFESSDERKVKDIEQLIHHGSFFSGPNSSTVKKKFTSEKKKEKVFPPPISLLNDDGKPNFILQPTRKDGRLEISEVKIQHQETLRSSREDGRLKLQLGAQEGEGTDETGEEEIDPTETKEEKEEDQPFPATEGGGEEGFRQCHDLHMWRKNHFHSVTIT